MTISRTNASPAAAFVELQGMWADLNMGLEPDEAFKQRWNALADIARAKHIVPKYPEPRVITRVLDDGISTKDGCA